MFAGKHVAAGAGVILVLLCAAVSVQASGPVGWIQETKGAVTLVSNGKSLPVKKGGAIMAQDRLKTGANSRVQVMFKDKSVLALGARSECRIGDVYLDKPEKSLVALTLEFLRGTFDVLAGRAAKLNPERFQVKTPMAVLGVRGTEFASAVDGASETHGLYAGGPVVVTKTGAKKTAAASKVNTAQLCEQIEATIDAAEKAYRDCRIAKQFAQSKSWESKVAAYEKLAKQYNCD